MRNRTQEQAVMDETARSPVAYV